MADFVAEVGDDSCVAPRANAINHSLLARDGPAHGHRTLHSLCKAHLCHRRWSDDELCEPAEVLRDCRQCELELSTTWSTQAQTTEPKDTLEMCKQHLNTFAIAPRSLECFGFGHRPCHVTGLLVEASLDSAERSLWAALCLECAATTVACSREIEKGLPIIDQLARRGENLAGRTNVNVPPLVEGEVFPTEGPILALRLVDHWDIRRDLGLVDQPVEASSGTVSRIARQPFGFDVEA